MTIATNAVYENGILKPKNPLPFAESQEVHLKIELSNVPVASHRKSIAEIECILDDLAMDAPADLAPLPADFSRADFYEDAE